MFSFCITFVSHSFCFRLTFVSLFVSRSFHFLFPFVSFPFHFLFPFISLLFPFRFLFVSLSFPFFIFVSLSFLFRFPYVFERIGVSLNGLQPYTRVGSNVADPNPIFCYLGSGLFVDLKTDNNKKLDSDTDSAMNSDPHGSGSAALEEV